MEIQGKLSFPYHSGKIATFSPAWVCTVTRGHCDPVCHISPCPRCRGCHHQGYRHYGRSHKPLPPHAYPSLTLQDGECPGFWRRKEWGREVN